MPAKRAGSKQPKADSGLTMRQAVAQDLQRRVPALRLSWKFGHASLQTDAGKIYCFVTRDGSFAMKLPVKRIETLLAAGEASPMRMGKRTMREWVVIPQTDSALQLFAEAEAYVAFLPPARPKAKPKAKPAATLMANPRSQRTAK